MKCRRLLFVICLVFLGNFCERGQASGFISEQDLSRFTMIARKTDMTTSLNTYMAASILSFAGVECSLECDDITSKMGTLATVSQMYHIGAALKACSCPSKPAFNMDMIRSAARSRSLSEMHNAMRMLHMLGLEKADINWFEVVENVVDLMAEDGTFAESAESDSTAGNTGLALDTIALALSFMDEDTKESARDLVAGAADAAHTLLAAAEDNCGGSDALFLGSVRDRLQSTSTVLEGTTHLLRQLRDSVDVTPSHIYRLGNFFVSQKSVGDLPGAFHLLKGLRAAMHSPVATPVAVITTPTMSDSSTAKYVVSIRNLLGQPVDKCQVSLSATSVADERVFLRSEPMVAIADQNSAINYELDVLQHGPLPGLYSMQIDVKNEARSIRAQVKRTLKIRTKITASELTFSTSSRPTSPLTSTQTITFPDSFAEKVVVSRSTPFMRLSLTLTSNSGPISPHQVMVRFTHLRGGESTYFVLEPDTKTVGQHDALVDCRDKRTWLSGSGDHRAVVIVGDHLLHKSVVWDLGIWSLRLPPTALKKTMPLYQQSLSHESETSMHALPEIIHQVKQPAPRPPKAISLFFTGIVVLPVVIFVLHTVLTYSTRAMALAGAWAFLFQFCIGLTFLLYLLFWYTLDLFTTLKYLIPLSVVTMCIGSLTLQKLTQS